MEGNLSEIRHFKKIIFGFLLLLVIFISVVMISRKMVEDEVSDKMKNLAREMIESVENEPGMNKISEETVYFDKPTEFSPRMVINGVFIVESSQFLNRETKGRKSGDLEDTAVLIEVTDPNHIDRWLESVRTQRKSSKDLQIYLYSSEIDLKTLRLLARKNRTGMKAIKAISDFSAASEAFSRGKEFVIFVKDTDYAGADFADFYFFGKSILEIDQNIEGICGGNIRNFSSNPEMGDVFWLTDMICSTGNMYPRRKYEPEFRSDLTIMVRPEVPRVADSPEKVTDSTWNIDFYSPDLMRIDEFERRLEYDLGKAQKMEIHDWEDMSEKDIDTNEIYMFEYRKYSGLDNHYFPKFNQDSIFTLPAYKGIIPKFSGDVKMYFVPSSTFKTRFIDHGE